MQKEQVQGERPNRMAEAREQAGLKPHEAAVEFGVDPSTIYRWEKDPSKLTVGQLERLARRYGTTVSWLLGLDDPAPAAATRMTVDARDFTLAMRRAFKGIRRVPRRARERELGLGLAAVRSDAERRLRMRAIDDRSPLRPGRGDLVTGQAAVRELERVERRRRGGEK